MVRTVDYVIDPLGRCDTPNAAKVLRMSPGTLANLRASGRGPDWIKVGGKVFYKFADLEAYGLGQTPAKAA